jgi:hypothetical protein
LTLGVVAAAGAVVAGVAAGDGDDSFEEDFFISELLESVL